MLTLIECKKKTIYMKIIDNVVVKEVTKEEAKEVELIKDMEKSFVIAASSQVISQEISRTPL